MGVADDRLAILELSYKYGQALDHDLAVWDEVFTDDAVLEYPGPTTAAMRTMTRDEMKQHVAELKQRGLVSQHLISNVVLRSIEHGSAAGTAEGRVLACTPVAEGIELTDRIAHYEDVYTRTGSGWRIVRKRATVRWTDRRIVGSD